MTIKSEHEMAIISFRKSRSLIDRILVMMDKQEYCIDIMQQNLAVIGLLKSAHQQLMESHLHSCFSKAMDSKQEKRKVEMVDEILKVTKMASK